MKKRPPMMLIPSLGATPLLQESTSSYKDTYHHHFFLPFSVYFFECNTDVKKCWLFTVTTETEMSMSGEVMDTQSMVTTVNKCGLTAAEAKVEADGLATTSTTTEQGITLKLTSTVTYAEVTE